MMTNEDWRAVDYGGFMVRAMALIIDGFIISFIAMILPFGPWAWLIAPVYTIMFWIKKQSTPGKMLFSLVVVNGETGLPATPVDYIIRYMGYWFSALIFFLGYFWVIFHDRKKAWHDMFADTVVVDKDTLPHYYLGRETYEEPDY